MSDIKPMPDIFAANYTGEHRPWMKVLEYGGEVEGEYAIDPRDINAALKFGSYLEKQGFERFALSSDTLTFKLGWYIDTHEAGMVAKRTDSKEYVFAVCLTRFSLAELPTHDFEKMKEEFRIAETHRDIGLKIARDSLMAAQPKEAV